MKKVLYIVSGRPVERKDPGRKISSIMACWCRLGYNIRAIFGRDIADDTGPLKSKNSHRLSRAEWYKRYRLLAPFVHSVSERRDFVHNLKMIEHVNSVVDSFGPDIIWQRSFLMHSAGLEAAKRAGVPYVHEWKDHLIPYSISWYHRRAVALERRKNQEADFVVVESDRLRKDLAQEGVEEGKILVAHNAADLDQFKPDPIGRQEYRGRLGIKEDEVLIGYLGSYAFYHDTIRLVLAADILRAQKDIKAKVLMVGMGTGYEKTHLLASKLRLLDLTVIMRPPVPTEMVPKVLSALDIAVLPGSTDIICPIKVQEYMASGLVSVVPDYPANRDVITDGQTGGLFEPENEKSLAEKLALLAHDGKTRTAIGKKARQEVAERFTWEKTWGKVLQEIMNRI